MFEDTIYSSSPFKRMRDAFKVTKVCFYPKFSIIKKLIVDNKELSNFSEIFKKEKIFIQLKIFFSKKSKTKVY